MQKINLNRILMDIEIDYVKKALEHTGNNTTQAADLLGIKRTSLVERLKTLGMEIQRPEKKIISKKIDKRYADKYFVQSSKNIENELYNE